MKYGKMILITLLSSLFSEIHCMEESTGLESEDVKVQCIDNGIKVFNNKKYRYLRFDNKDLYSMLESGENPQKALIYLSMNGGRGFYTLDEGGLTEEDAFQVIIKDLLKKGANINAVNPEMSNRTPLLEAINVSVKTSFIEALLKNGADVNTTDKFGRTALMNARAYGRLDIFKLLLENDAKIAIEDAEGHTVEHENYAPNKHHKFFKSDDLNEQQGVLALKDKIRDVISEN